MKRRLAELLLLLLGGCVGSGENPDERRWERLSDGNGGAAGRSRSGVFIHGSDFHVYGGFQSEKMGEVGQPTDFWKFDLARRAWHRYDKKGDGPKPVHHPGMLWNGVRFYFGGGRIDNDRGLPATDPVLWDFDPDEGRWRRLGEWPNILSRLGPYWAWIGDRILMFGGLTAELARLWDLWEYFPGKNEWKKVEIVGSEPALSKYPKDQIAGSVWTGRDLLLFGSSFEGQFDNVWAFNWTTRRWRELKPPEKRPVYRASPSIVSDGLGKVYLFGGYRGGDMGGSATDFLDDLWCFNSIDNEWTVVESAGPRPSARAQAAGAFHDGSFYIYGGTLPGLRPAGDLWRIPVR